MHACTPPHFSRTFLFFRGAVSIVVAADGKGFVFTLTMMVLEVVEACLYCTLAGRAVFGHSAKTTRFSLVPLRQRTHGRTDERTGHFVTPVPVIGSRNRNLQQTRSCACAD
jgi:hypothetical protein